MGSVLKTIAPIAASLIPGVGPIAGPLVGAGIGAAGGGGIKGALTGGLGGFGASRLLGQGGLGGVASQIGNAFSNPQGQPDFGKIVGAAGTAMNLIGQGQQRKSAQDYANANIAQRNALMSKILAPQNYNVPNLNQQSSATPGTGAGTTGGNY
jgi:hypothetical protein